MDRRMCMPGAQPGGLSLPLCVPSPVVENKLIGKLQDNLYQPLIQHLCIFSSDVWAPAEKGCV